MNDQGVATQRRFAAFISYRHLDNTDEGRRWAEWLHRWIESYRVPRALVGAIGEFGIIPARVAPVFRDEWEMRGGGNLRALIEEGLRGSECLIVLCSPRSAVSPWVPDEVEKFKALGKEQRIIPVLIQGEPGASAAVSSDSERRTRECLPETLRGGVRAVGPPTTEGLHPIDWSARFERTPCDFRPKGTHDMGFTNAAAYRESLEVADQILPKLQRRSSAQFRDLEERYAERLRIERLRVMAGLLGVSLEELNSRDAAARARRWRRLFYLTSAIVALIAVLALSVWRQSAKRQDLLEVASARDHAAAEQALIEEDWPLAIAYLDRALTYWPDNPDAASLLWSLLRHGPAADALAPRQLHSLDQPVQGLAWSPDSQSLMVRLAAGEVRILDVRAARFPHPPLALGEIPEIYQWAKDGNAMIFVTAAGGWWHASGPDVAPVHLAVASARALLGQPFSPDGKRIVARTSDGALQIFDAATGAPGAVLAATREPVPSGIPRATWRPDGRAVLVETPSGVVPSLPKVRLWLREFSAETGQPETLKIPSIRSHTADFAYSATGQFLLVNQGRKINQPAGGNEAQIEFYQGAGLVANPSAIEHFQWHPVRDEVFTWGHLSLLRRRAPEKIEAPSPTYDLADPESVALDAAGKLLVVAPELGENATLYDVSRFKPRAHWAGGQGLSSWHSLSPDGCWWAIVMNDTKLILCRVAPAFPALPPSSLDEHPHAQPADQQSTPAESAGYRVAFEDADELAVYRTSNERLVGRVTMLSQIYRNVHWADSPRRLVCTTPSGSEFLLPWEPPCRGDRAIQHWAVALGGTQLTASGAPGKLPMETRISAWKTIAAHRPKDPSWQSLLEWWRADRPLAIEPP